MASAISYEFFQSKQAMPNGLATLDANGKIPLSQLPNFDLPTTLPSSTSEVHFQSIQAYKGKYATIDELITSYPLAELADYAYVVSTYSFWYWNEALEIPSWVNQQISETDYLILNSAAKLTVPYIVGP